MERLLCFELSLAVGDEMVSIARCCGLQLRMRGSEEDDLELEWAKHSEAMG